MIDKRSYLISEYASDEKKLANYIEIQLSTGKSLSEVKKELYYAGIPQLTLNKATAIVFKDEVQTIQTGPHDNLKPENLKPDKPKNKYIDIIFNIFAIICIAIAVFFFLKMLMP